MLKVWCYKLSVFKFILSCFIFSKAIAMPLGIPGNAKTDTCIACHDSDGNSKTSIWPKIAGQHESYLYNQLIEFQKGESGNRYDPSMYPMVQALSEQELADLASYYSQQKTTLGEVLEDKVALGGKIYRGGNVDKGITACAACHGPKGMGNELANYPRLSGQNIEYTASQLKKYRSGDRKGDPNAIMRMIAAKMTDEEIDAVSHYVSGLH